MIELETARSGERVLRKNGKSLASLFNPIRDAEAWADKVFLSLEGSGGPKALPETLPDTLVILGMGSAYHIAAAKKRAGKMRLLVMDDDEELRRCALTLCPQISDINIVIEPDWTKLIERSEIKDVLSGVYRMASYGPSFHTNPGYFSSLERFFLGRDKLSFLLQLKAHPEILPLLDAKAISDIQAEAIGIKTMSGLFSQKANAAHSRRLWKILEELIV